MPNIPEIDKYNHGNQIDSAPGMRRIPSSMSLKNGGTLSQTRVLGKGRYGSVRLFERADHPEDRVAVKNMTDYAREIASESLEKEYQTLSQVYPEESFYYFSGRVPSQARLVMPYHEMSMLKDIYPNLNNNKDSALIWQMAINEVLRISLKSGVLHTDLHPGNILYSENSSSGSYEVRIIDWGIVFKKDDSYFHPPEKYTTCAFNIIRLFKYYYSDYWQLPDISNFLRGNDFRVNSYNTLCDFYWKYSCFLGDIYKSRSSQTASLYGTEMSEFTVDRTLSLLEKLAGHLISKLSAVYGRDNGKGDAFQIVRWFCRLYPQLALTDEKQKCILKSLIQIALVVRGWNSSAQTNTGKAALTFINSHSELRSLFNKIFFDQMRRPRLEVVPITYEDLLRVAGCDTVSPSSGENKYKIFTDAVLAGIV